MKCVFEIKNDFVLFSISFPDDFQLWKPWRKNWPKSWRKKKEEKW